MQNLRSKAPQVSQSSPLPILAPANSQQPLAVAQRDFASGPNTPPQSSHSMCPPNANGPSNNSNSSNVSLPPQIAAAVQILAAYIQNDPESRQRSHRNSGPSNTFHLPLPYQQHPLQALHNLSTFHTDNGALTALLTQASNLATGSAFANAMYDSGTSTPLSQQDELSLYGRNHSTDSSQGYSPMSLPFLQNSMPYQGESTFMAQSQNSDEFMARYHAFPAGMQDPSPTY